MPDIRISSQKVIYIDKRKSIISCFYEKWQMTAILNGNSLKWEQITFRTPTGRTIKSTHKAMISCIDASHLWRPILDGYLTYKIYVSKESVPILLVKLQSFYLNWDIIHTS